MALSLLAGRIIAPVATNVVSKALFGWIAPKVTHPEAEWVGSTPSKPENAPRLYIQGGRTKLLSAGSAIAAIWAYREGLIDTQQLVEYVVAAVAAWTLRDAVS